MGARAQGEFSDRKRTCNDILPCMGAFTVNRKRDTQKGPWGSAFSTKLYFQSKNIAATLIRLFTEMKGIFSVLQIQNGFSLEQKTLPSKTLCSSWFLYQVLQASSLVLIIDVYSPFPYVFLLVPWKCIYFKTVHFCTAFINGNMEELQGGKERRLKSQLQTEPILHREVSLLSHWIRSVLCSLAGYFWAFLTNFTSDGQKYDEC